MDYIRGHSNGVTRMDHIAHTRFLFSTLAAVGLGGAAVGAAAAHPTVQKPFKDGADLVRQAPQGILDLHKQHMDWHKQNLNWHLGNLKKAEPVLQGIGKAANILQGGIVKDWHNSRDSHSQTQRGRDNFFQMFAPK